jgi:hypothetical protein
LKKPFAMRQLAVAKRRFGSDPAAPTREPRGRKTSDCVAKVVLHWWSEILRAADAIFV